MTVSLSRSEGALPSRTLGRRIARVRRARGLTQAALADAIGVQTWTVGRWECGMRAPGDVEVFLRLCETLDISPAFLWRGRVS